MTHDDKAWKEICVSRLWAKQPSLAFKAKVWLRPNTKPFQAVHVTGRRSWWSYHGFAFGLLQMEFRWQSVSNPGRFQSQAIKEVLVILVSSSPHVKAFIRPSPWSRGGTIIIVIIQAVTMKHLSLFVPLAFEHFLQLLFFSISQIFPCVIYSM